jgi:hypothetical protein
MPNTHTWSIANLERNTVAQMEQTLHQHTERHPIQVYHQTMITFLMMI